MTIQDERAAFDRQLRELLAVHEGEWVVFRDAAPVSFHPTFEAAYTDGVERFGAEPFLVTQVVKPAR